MPVGPGNRRGANAPLLRGAGGPTDQAPHRGTGGYLRHDVSATASASAQAQVEVEQHIERQLYGFHALVLLVSSLHANDLRMTNMETGLQVLRDCWWVDTALTTDRKVSGTSCPCHHDAARRIVPEYSVPALMITSCTTMVNERGRDHHHVVKMGIAVTHPGHCHSWSLPMEQSLKKPAHAHRSIVNRGAVWTSYQNQLHSSPRAQQQRPSNRSWQ